ncbi:MAG: hypothetical protein LBF34_04600, partial [Puniceicoccales bacterium]|nr:hypothetical protein [Puniceicoccales bacterium]
IHPNLELFETLIELGADVNIPNHEGKTPLDLLLQRKEELLVGDEALTNEYDQAIALLREHGAVEGHLKYETESQPEENSEDEDETENQIKDESKNEKTAKESKTEDEAKDETEN